MVDDRPMQPQDAFAELGRISLAEASLESVMERIAALTKRTVPGASEVSVTLVERGKASTVAFTGALAIDLDERQYDKGYGPCLDSIEGGEPVVIGDMETETRWAAWAQEASRCGAGSSLSIPVPLQREVTAALNIYSTERAAFTEPDIEVATTFAAYAGVALANMHLYQAQSRLAEDLQTAMKNRAVIEQAKGILMGAKHCTAEQAFELLVDLSQTSNRKLRDVAHAIVAEALRTP
jgi:GAF domain-containing protein